MRKFELVREDMRKNEYTPNLPKRGSKGSAGYDFVSTVEVTLRPNEEVMIWSDIKACMEHDEVLKLYPRSSMGMKGLEIKNTVGIVDSTYYGNPNNDGNIGFKLVNRGDNDIVINKGERIIQGVFLKFLTVDGDDDNLLEDRVGGYGSTGK